MVQLNEKTILEPKNVEQFTPNHRETSEAFLARITRNYCTYFMERSNEAALQEYKKTILNSHMSWEEWRETEGKDPHDSKKTIRGKYKKMITMAKKGQVEHLADSAIKYSKKFPQAINTIVSKLGVDETNTNSITMAEITRRGEEIKLAIVQTEKKTTFVIRAIVRHDLCCYLFVRYKPESKTKLLVLNNKPAE